MTHCGHRLKNLRSRINQSGGTYELGGNWSNSRNSRAAGYRSQKKANGIFLRKRPDYMHLLPHGCERETWLSSVVTVCQTSFHPV
jgi:hypothetical protein